VPSLRSGARNAEREVADGATTTVGDGSDLSRYLPTWCWADGFRDMACGSSGPRRARRSDVGTRGPRTPRDRWSCWSGRASVWEGGCLRGSDQVGGSFPFHREGNHSNAVASLHRHMVGSFGSRACRRRADTCSPRAEPRADPARVPLRGSRHYLSASRHGERASMLHHSVRIRPLTDPTSARDDASYWRQQPPALRLAAVELLRRQVYGAPTRLLRIARVVQRESR
jgi:hypothetical protein